MSSKVSMILVALAIVGTSSAGWFWLRRAKVVSIAPEKLHYPCLRIIDGSVWDSIDGLKDLGQISSNRFMNRREDPIVIDSEFRVFAMSNLKMQGSELGLLITGPRQVDVEFELIVRHDQSADDAKAMLVDLLSKRSTFTEDSMGSIPRAMSLDDFIELLESPDPGVTPSPTSPDP